MIYCFDIDGTLSERPMIFATVMEALLKAGHQVYPLTAAMSSWGPDIEARRLAQLSKLGFEKGIHFTDVVVCVAGTLESCGNLKGQFCKDMNVSLMVEDTSIYADAIKRLSPATLCLRMP